MFANVSAERRIVGHKGLAKGVMPLVAYPPPRFIHVIQGCPSSLLFTVWFCNFICRYQTRLPLILASVDLDLEFRHWLLSHLLASV